VTGASDAVQKALLARQTQKRQAALDDIGTLNTIQKMIDEKKAKDEAKKNREEGLTIAGWSRDPDGKLVMIPGQKADLEIQEKKATVGSVAEEKRLNREYKRALIDSVGAKTKATEAKAGAAKDYKKEQYDAATFARRLEQAENVFGALQDQGYNRADLKESLQNTRYFPSVLQSGDFKKQDQAERNFVNAVLRRESGAAISPSEFESAEKQYFPRAGDPPEVIAQKKANRLQALEGLKAAAGGAMGQVPLISSTPSAGKPKTVVQNGHTYVLNEATGEYE
jgi:hypothetical protein